MQQSVGLRDIFAYEICNIDVFLLHLNVSMLCCVCLVTLCNAYTGCGSFVVHLKIVNCLCIKTIYSFIVLKEKNILCYLSLSRFVAGTRAFYKYSKQGGLYMHTH